MPCPLSLSLTDCPSSETISQYSTPITALTHCPTRFCWLRRERCMLGISRLFSTSHYHQFGNKIKAMFWTEGKYFKWPSAFSFSFSWAACSSKFSLFFASISSSFRLCSSFFFLLFSFLFSLLAAKASLLLSSLSCKSSREQFWQGSPSTSRTADVFCCLEAAFWIKIIYKPEAQFSSSHILDVFS